MAAPVQIGITNPARPDALINTLPTVGGAPPNLSIPVVEASYGPTALANSFTSTANSAAIQVYGDFNITLTGAFSATVKVQRQFLNDVNWHDLTQLGLLVAYSSPVSEIQTEPEANVAYRLVCTAYTSGTVNYRISQ